MLNFRRAQQIVTLADERSFTHAANKLGMSQPALSRAIALIESECGLRLFDRSRAGVEPTSAGAELVANIRQIIGQLGLVEQNLVLQGKGELGTVRFAIGPLAAGYLMDNLITECVQRWPLLYLATAVLDTRSIVTAVLQGALDFGICSASTLESIPDLLVRPIGSLTMTLFVRAGHPLARFDGAITADMLAPYPRASGYIRPMPDGRLIRPFAPLDTTIECDDFRALRRVTLRTDTIWTSSASLIRDDLRMGHLVEIQVSGLSPPRKADIVSVMLNGRSQLPAVHHVIAAAEGLMDRAASEDRA